MVESLVLTQRNSVDQRSSRIKTMKKRPLKIQAEEGPKLKIQAEMEPRMRTWLATGPTLERVPHYWSLGR